VSAPAGFAPSYGLLTDLDELRRVIGSLIAEGKPFGFDIETGYEGETRESASLHPEENFVAGISFTNSLSWARYVPLKHDTGINVDNLEVARILWPLFQVRDSEGVPLGVAHGAKFELRCMSRWFMSLLADDPEFGLEVSAYNGYFKVRSCTLLESFVEGVNPRHGLKPLTQMNFGYDQPELLSLFPEGLTKKEQSSLRFSVLDQHDQKVINYACEDSLWCLVHHLRRYPKLKDKFIYQLEMEVLYVVCEMEDEGVLYDWNMLKNQASKVLDFADLYLVEVLDGFNQLAGEQVTINFASPVQLRDLLYNKCHMPVSFWTKGGKTGNRQPSTDAKRALPKLAKEFPQVQHYLNWKRLTTLRRNFLESYEAKYLWAEDGRAHPSLIQHGTVTGRYSANSPNYQQSPKKYEYALESGTEYKFNFRTAIVAPPGQYILGFDYSQIELRALAGEAGETALIEAFTRGEDVHRKTAALMLGKAMDDVTDDDRGVGKTMNFALSYQMSAEGLADRLGLSLEEAENLFTQYFATYSKVKAYMDRTVDQAKQDGYVTTRFGRRVPLFGLDHPSRRVRKDAERSAGNAPIQGSATGDYAKLAMVRAHKAIRKAGLQHQVKMVMNIHDALEFYVDMDVDPVDVIRVLEPAVTGVKVPGWPPMVADWHLGKSWGSVVDVFVDEAGVLRHKKKDAKVEIIEISADEEDVELPVTAAAIQSVLAGASPGLPVHGPGHLADQRPGNPGVPAEHPDPGGVSGGGHDAQRVGHPGTVPPSRVIPRTVVVQVHRAPTPGQFQKFREELRDGPNTVVLRMPDGEAVLPHTYDLDPGQEPQVSIIFGGALMHYALDSVDMDALARDLEL
jgi:DNA polymerase I-like protein with 3'-5' exonuclease and polymerase domains